MKGKSHEQGYAQIAPQICYPKVPNGAPIAIPMKMMPNSMTRVKGRRWRR
jgi:hypothetical protein